MCVTFFCQKHCKTEESPKGSIKEVGAAAKTLTNTQFFAQNIIKTEESPKELPNEGGAAAKTLAKNTFLRHHNLSFMCFSPSGREGPQQGKGVGG